MIWRNVEEQQAVHRLDTQRTYAGAVVGDNSVVTAILHVDCLGATCLIRWKAEPINVRIGHVPSVREITAALGRAWVAMWGNDDVQYSRFFLCLPGWCCRSKDVAREIEIGSGGRLAVFKKDMVAPGHIRQLENAIVAEDVSPQHVVIDLLHHAHVVDGEERMANAVGNHARRIGLEGHVVVADRHIVGELLDCLRDMRIYVDEIISPYTAVAGYVSPEEKDRGAAVFQVGRRALYGSFFKAGNLVRTAMLKGGSDDVAAKAAERLDVALSDLTSYVNERKAILYSQGDKNKMAALPLFRWRATHPVLRKLDDAAVEPAGGLLDEIGKSVQAARGQHSMEMARVALVGDDYLVLRVLRDMVEEKLGIPCRWEIPDRVHGHDIGSMPGLACMIGMMRICGQNPAGHRRQVFLDNYNESFMNLFLRRFSTRAVAMAKNTIARRNLARKEPKVNGAVPVGAVLHGFGQSRRY